MKISALLFGAFVALFSVSAQAVIVDPNEQNFETTAYSVEMGPVHADQYGIISTTPFAGVNDLVLGGSLNPYTTITFTYTIVPKDPSAWNGTANFWTVPETSVDGVKTVEIEHPTSNTFTLMIANLIADPLNFVAGIVMPFGFTGDVLTQYNAVSNVPLPAALPLFGLGLIGLAGYRAKRKAAA